MTLEKRTRVEIFHPLKPDSVVHRTLTEWLAEELAFARGGATLTTPFTGLYTSETHANILRDSVQVLFCDFDLDPDDPAHRPEVVAYLRTLRLMLMEVLRQEDVWIIYHSVTRIA